MRAIVLSTIVMLSGTASAAETGATFDPVFECHRVNTAWGFVMSGAAVARDGSVVRYRLRDKDMRPTPQTDAGVTYYEAATLRAHLADATPAAAIDADQLRTNLALVDDAAKGTVSTAATGVRDAGISTCHAYIFDADKRRYRDVELGSDNAVSDTRVTNDAKAAATLLDWLKTVGIASK